MPEGDHFVSDLMRYPLTWKRIQPLLTRYDELRAAAVLVVNTGRGYFTDPNGDPGVPDAYSVPASLFHALAKALDER